MLIWHMPRVTRSEVVPHASRVSLGRAVERALKASEVQTQENLADLLQVHQTTVSKIISGKRSMTVERVAEIERLCGLPSGQILFWAGFVDAEILLAPHHGSDFEIAARSGAELSPSDQKAVATAAKRARRPRK